MTGFRFSNRGLVKKSDQGTGFRTRMSNLLCEQKTAIDEVINRAVDRAKSSDRQSCNDGQSDKQSHRYSEDKAIDRSTSAIQSEMYGPGKK